MYNIVTRPQLIDQFKTSKYWKQNLGLVSTMENNGQRSFNEKDKFAHFYNTRYRTTIHMKGTIGNIIVYMDYYVKGDFIAIYVNSEEFVFEWNHKMVREKGIDFYLGHLLKTLETNELEKIEKAKEEQIDVKAKADPNKLRTNPGAVNYEDIKAYLAEKNKNRLSVDK